MDAGTTTLTIGPDATRHMRHYMNNTGNELRLDLSRLLQRSVQLKRQFDQELAEAQRFVETLEPGRHSLSSQRLAQGYFRQSDDRNLFFAIGGYSYWGMGEVELMRDPPDSEDLRAEMDFSFHFFDRYNWDGGKKVEIAGVTITDAFMQQFHRQCYAREYDVRGIHRQRVVWQFKRRLGNPFELLK